MVKPQRIDKPLPKESETEPELTGLDQLSEQERARIAARKVGGVGPAPVPVLARAAPQLPLADVPDDEPQPVMTRRSWYVTKASADALAAAVDDIHHITRGVPKHVIASMMFDLAARNADGIAQELGRTLASRITSDTGDMR